jgi:hypothetical protein
MVTIVIIFLSGFVYLYNFDLELRPKIEQKATAATDKAADRFRQAEADETAANARLLEVDPTVDIAGQSQASQVLAKCNASPWRKKKCTEDDAYANRKQLKHQKQKDYANRLPKAQTACIHFAKGVCRAGSNCRRFSPAHPCVAIKRNIGFANVKLNRTPRHIINKSKTTMIQTIALYIVRFSLKLHA